MTSPITPLALVVAAWTRLRTSPRLRRSVAAWTAAGLVVAVGGSAAAALVARGHDLRGLGPLWPVAGVGWWLMVAGSLAAATPLLLEVPTGRLLDRVGAPNGLTALRAFGCAPVVLFALVPDRELGRALFLAVGSPVALLDALDGYLARTAGPVTVLGRALDPAMDTLFFACCAVAALLLGLVPVWFAILILARYGLPGIAFLLVYPQLRRRPTLVATPFGKASTLLISGALLVSALLVMAGGPAARFQEAVAVPIAATAIGHGVVLARRTRLAAELPVPPPGP